MAYTGLTRVALLCAVVSAIFAVSPSRVRRAVTGIAAAAQITSIHMIDASSGWAVNVGPAAILRTTDGGIAWADVAPRGGASLDSGVTTCFLTAQVAWAAIQRPTIQRGRTTVLRSTIYRTTDGGQSWRGVDLPIQLPYQITFVDPQHGWLWEGGAAMGSMAIEIYRTSDGGAHWTSVSYTSFPGFHPSTPGSLPIGGDKSGLGFSTAAMGYATGFTPAKGFVWLYATRDGGRAWRHHDLPLTSAYRNSSGGIYVEPPTFFGAHNGVLPVSTGLTTRNTPPSMITTFYATHDGGATWHGTAPLIYTSIENPLSSSFVDAREGWATAGAKLYMTRDGAEHWTTLTPNVSLRYVVALDFVDGHDGWALGHGSDSSVDHPFLLRTRDGGRTWNLYPYLLLLPR